MEPKKNGVTVELLGAYGPYELWEADEWACPGCGLSVITGFADAAFAYDDDPDFEALLAREAAAGRIRATVR